MECLISEWLLYSPLVFPNISLPSAWVMMNLVQLYTALKRCLNPGGIFVAQNGVCFLQQEEAIDSPRKLSHYFSDVGFYQAAIPTYYGGIMTFAWATDNDALRHLSTEIIQARFLASGLKCRYYNPAVHTAAFALPQYLQDALASQPS